MSLRVHKRPGSDCATWGPITCRNFHFWELFLRTVQTYEVVEIWEPSEKSAKLGRYGNATASEFTPQR